MKKTVSLFLIFVMFCSCFCLQSCGVVEKEPFEYFKADKVDVLIDMPTDVLFTAKLSGSKKADCIEVFQGEEKAFELYDDGENGDAVADDGIFSGYLSAVSEEEKYVDYYAKAGSNKSETVTLFFYSELTDEEYREVLDVNESLYDVQSMYADEDGYVPQDDLDVLIADMCKRLNVYIEEGTVESYTIFNNIFSIEFSNGITHLFMPHIEGILSSGGVKNIVTVEPYASSFASVTNDGFVWLDKKLFGLEYQGAYDIAGNASMIDDEFESYSYTQHLPDSSATLSEIKALGDGRLKNGVFIWQGHGGYSETVGSVLVTGEDATKKNNETVYSADLKAKRLVTTGGWYTLGTDYINCSYGITSKFIDKYFDDGALDNALVYLGACLSGTGEELVDSLLNKGEDSVVFACVGSIGMEFEAMTRTMLLYNMCKGNGKGKYPTAENAIKDTWEEVGYYDTAHDDSFVACYGNTKYRFSDEFAQDAETVAPTEKPTEAQDSGTVYDDIIKRYRTAAQNNYFEGDMEKCGDINLELWFSAYKDSRLAYVLADLSDDGSPELIIAALNGKYSNAYQIYDIWGQENGAPKRIFDIGSMGYRAIYNITKDDRIVKYHSELATWEDVPGYENSMWIIFHEIYSVVPDTANAKFETGFKREDFDGEDYCYYISEDGTEIGHFPDFVDYEKALAENSARKDFEWTVIHDGTEE